MVDAYARQMPTELVVGHSGGGAQALHNVISPTGVHHKLTQFGSATLISEVKTCLGTEMLIHPQKLLIENCNQCWIVEN